MNLGFKTLFRKEVQRFLRVPGQTLISPLITTTLYFIIFGMSLTLKEIPNPLDPDNPIPYARFIVPGLVMLGVISNSFLNTSSSLFVSKIQGTVVDLLIVPIAYSQILAAFVMAAMVRGMMVGGAMWVVASLFTNFEVKYPLLALVFLMLVSALFGTVGVIVAIWAEKFEQINLVPTFIITPLTFLGGVFYSVKTLPETFQTLAYFNPVLYMVEGLRFAILGFSDVELWKGLLILTLLTSIAIAVAYRWLVSGYKLRS